MPGPQQRGLRTRDTLLRSAATVIDRKGFTATTIEDIATEANVTKGALYHHFQSKESLAEAIVDEQGEWLSAHFNPEQPVQTVVDISYAFTHALQTDPLLRASIRMTVERSASPQHITAGYLTWIDGVTTLLELASAAGELRDGIDPARTAYLLASSVTGLQITSDALTGRTDLAGRVHDYWRLVMPSLVPPELLDRVDVRPPSTRRPPVGDPT